MASKLPFSETLRPFNVEERVKGLQVLYRFRLIYSSYVLLLIIVFFPLLNVS